MSDYPKDLLYSEEHEWARIEGTLATIGITSFAVEQLGDVTQVDLPKEGETLTQGEAMGSVESVKAVSDLFAPLSGKVVKVNTVLHESPQHLNEEPYDEGWMIQIALTKPDEKDKLMSTDAYETFLQDSAD